MMGAEGLKAATESAILAANYVARRLAPHYPVLYSGPGGLVAHECILDLRPLKADQRCQRRRRRQATHRLRLSRANDEFPGRGHADDRADRKRVQGRTGPLHRRHDRDSRGNPRDRRRQHGSPRQRAEERAAHSRRRLLGADWHARLFARACSVSACPRCANNKYWPPVARADNVYGDRNLSCSCIPVADYAE